MKLTTIPAGTQVQFYIMDLLQRFQAFVHHEHLFSKKDQLLIAVSGGVDSVVLCELCHQAGFSFAIAHANFQLRGVESERDAAFVEELAKKYNVVCFVKKFDTAAYAEQNKVSIQVAARELRYTWFEEIISSATTNQTTEELSTTAGAGKLSNQHDKELPKSRADKRPAAITSSSLPGSKPEEPQPSSLSGSQSEESQSSSLSKSQSTESQPASLSASVSKEVSKKSRNFQFILTAHHLNDSVETMLMNFFKGTGITGLRGILPKQGSLVRPLLFATKEELLQFAQAHSLQWVEDSSNALDKYSRNYFRHRVIPLVQQIYPGVEKNLADNLARFRDTEILYQQAVAQQLKKLLEYKDAEVHIPVLKLQKAEPLPTLVYEIIKNYGFSPQQVPEVTALLESNTGKYVQSSTHRIIRNRQWLIIAPLAAEDARHILIGSSKDPIAFATGTLTITEHPAKGFVLPDNNTIAVLDASLVQFPLLLRPWKQGDYFYPLGMKKKKKLARFFIDQKLSKTAKEKVWVLEMNKKIIWVVGHRIDERFKITPATQQILQIKLT